MVKKHVIRNLEFMELELKETLKKSHIAQLFFFRQINIHTFRHIWHLVALFYEMRRYDLTDIIITATY